MSTAAVERETAEPLLSACLFNEPKENSPRQLNLEDMLRVHALNFVRVGGLLERCSMLAKALPPNAGVDEPIISQFVDVVGSIEADAHELQLTHTAEIVSFHMRRFTSGMTNAELVSACGEIHRIYHSQVKGKMFVHLRPELADYFDKRDLFGDSVATAFPSVEYEIRDACTCYSLEQDTACVMHLMRVLEIALSIMAKEFAVSSARENWHNIIEGIQSKVNGLLPSDGTDWKDRQDFYSSACSQFMHFKNAWRNHAMHSRIRYSGPEAFRVLDHVRQFMQTLSLRLSEPNL